MDETEAGATTTETMNPMRISDLITRKKNGFPLAEDEMKHFIRCVSTLQADHSQIGAMLMAMCFRGLSDDEAFFMTEEIIESGVQLGWSGTVVDKHSTGGVGDKVSIPLVPALAANGLKIPMISGRGLGWTGGTLDKLESIPGYNASLDIPTMRKCIANNGCFISATTDNICPADKILYKIRDVTSTVDDPHLIIGSIISKKVAGGAKYLVLDLKIGEAAFTKDLMSGETFARKLIDMAQKFGIVTRVALTSMDSPIGNTIGNALEIKESVQCLRGNGSNDLLDLVTGLGGELLLMTGKVTSIEEGKSRIKDCLENGEALEKFRQMIICQGVNPETASNLLNGDMTVLPSAAKTTKLTSKHTGWVHYIDAKRLGNFCCKLGAGRRKGDDSIDPAVGIELHITPGSLIARGDVLMTVHHNIALTPDMMEELHNSVHLMPEEVKFPSRIVKVISM